MKKENCFFGILDIHKKFWFKEKACIKVSQRVAQTLDSGVEFIMAENEIVQVEGVYL